MEENSKEKIPEEYFIYYPSRRSRESPDLGLMEKLSYENLSSERWRLECEKNVSEILKRSPVLKILKNALSKAGCPINLKRHVVCETCTGPVAGGYDEEYNQVVICKNVYKSRNYPESVLLHEFIHMYDSCVNHFDPRNMEHLACTEIRAANLVHCSFLSSMLLGTSSPFNIKETHQNCVKLVAAKSVVAARQVDLETAMRYVLKVFDKCYHDLEPLGRRFRRKSKEPLMAEEECKCFFGFENN